MIITSGRGRDFVGVDSEVLHISAGKRERRKRDGDEVRAHHDVMDGRWLSDVCFVLREPKTQAQLLNNVAAIAKPR